jgi:hypothetical protein
VIPPRIDHYDAPGTAGGQPGADVTSDLHSGYASRFSQTRDDDVRLPQGSDLQESDSRRPPQTNLACMARAWHAEGQGFESP